MSLLDIISLKNPKSPIAEAYRTLRTNIQFSDLDKALKTIIITSSVPGEGKTTSICNLAVTMAQANSKVLLIDCDLRKSQLHKRFELSNSKGLTNVLAQKIPHQDIIQKTAIEGLDVLTAGPKPPNPSELLGSNAMKDFIAEMSKEYDRVLIDAPPIGVVTDAGILASFADGVILVVAARQVPIEGAQRSKELLERVQANILGVLLNKIPNDSRGYYSYYYYHEYYENDDTEDKPTHSKKRRKK
ncbi:capsular exopolysaccharide family [Desulfonispora thiosulfatigenes DSM 11270]|uniref:non-specific protein-tyrosine kinase n=1 Tax=Desulfonispora thiosulfatigenes DSM 11270 TaxID=656914 RepID=A0A1W1V6B0_DESTI|nr:CpsD/CapB family tyrosine-protein kinase [Desulfonispora thiosulfatigenes]SMB88947.1 capsular exopolysaccharide family [Desulfonispora thiosulfatigenes DSM 11270]